MPQYNITAEFTDPKIRKTNAPGPGAYEIEAGRRIGDEAKGVVKFESITARGDAVGPFGEKPLNHQVQLGDLLDDDYYREDEPGIEYGAARDAVDQTKAGLVAFDKVTVFYLHCIGDWASRCRCL